MKRIISIVLILVFLVLCVSCSESEKEPEPSGEGSDPENGAPEINRPEISIVYSDSFVAEKNDFLVKTKQADGTVF